MSQEIFDAIGRQIAAIKKAQFDAADEMMHLESLVDMLADEVGATTKMPPVNWTLSYGAITISGVVDTPEQLAEELKRTRSGQLSPDHYVGALTDRAHITEPPIRAAREVVLTDEKGRRLVGEYAYMKTAHIEPPRNIGELLCLVHSEVSEAMEGARKGLMDNHLPHRPMLEVELADAVIRCFDIAGGLKLDLAGAMAEKLTYNASRTDHQIENRNAEGGKRF